MQLTINGEARKLEGERFTVLELLTVQKVESPEMVAVQVNGVFVPRPQYEGWALQENDTVEFLYFMGGGSK
ncbi:MAG: thiamine biosynthesis protein ThiS [Deltaproteobacteria bacterium RIFOXYD12_FULL_55_16]|nr:MAG: thiamine biosynthesis protein ThiS [Deltaproteobacteria bacterium RIFOXYD12_FULL_55_16]